MPSPMELWTIPMWALLVDWFFTSPSNSPLGVWAFSCFTAIAIFLWIEYVSRRIFSCAEQRDEGPTASGEETC
jgi:hypothetical protein